MNQALGNTYKDLITGFKGVAVGYCEYLSGCNQVLLSPKIDKDGAHRSGVWIDEQRLIKNVHETKIELENGTTPGSDMEAPIK